MKNLKRINLLAISLFSLSVFALENIAVIDMRTAVLSTQAAENALKALEEDSTYAANLEEAQTLQAERQSIAENFEKNRETLSQEEIAKMQKDIQDKGKDLEFIAGKLQQAQEETIQRIFAENSASMQKIISELIQAKEIQILFQKSESILFSDVAIDLTDDVTSMMDVAASEANTQPE